MLEETREGCLRLRVTWLWARKTPGTHSAPVGLSKAAAYEVRMQSKLFFCLVTMSQLK